MWNEAKIDCLPVSLSWIKCSTYVKVNHLGVLTRAFRNLSRRKIRVLLVVIALSFSMAIMISIPSGVVANQEASQNLTEDYNSTITSMQEEINKTATLIECQTSSGQGFPSGAPTGMPIFGSRQEVFVDETVGDELHSIEGVKDVVPFLEKSSNETTSEAINTPRGSFTIYRPLYTITGVSLNSSLIDSYSILPTNVTAGRNLRDGDTGVLLMSSNLSDYSGVGVGGIMTINGESFTVVGIYEPTSQGRIETRMVTMNITDAQTVTGQIGNVSRFDVYAEDASYVDEIADVITATYSELSITTYKDRLTQLQNMQDMYNETLKNAESTLSQTQSVAFQEIVIAVVASGLIVLFTMLYTVRERTKEIGTLKAIGFSSWNVMSQFMLEGIFMSLMAGVVGVAIGSVAAPTLSSLLLPHVSMFGTGSFQGPGNPGAFASQTATAAVQTATATLDPQLMLLAFGVAVLLGAVGSLYPAWRAARTSPMEALRYE
jgi:putative ABC transport system permease protein